jgi:hypothetical protein
MKSVSNIILLVNSASLTKLATWLVIDGVASVNSKLLCIEQHLRNNHFSGQSWWHALQKSLWFAILNAEQQHFK